MKILFRSLYRFGDYILLLKKIFTTPDRWSEFFRRFKDEAYMLVIGSIAIVVTISLFIGAVITIQTQLNVSSPLLAGLYRRTRYPRHAAIGIFVFDHVSAAGRENRLEHCIGNRNHASYRTNRRSRHHGGKLGQLPDTSQNRRHGSIYSGIGRFQHVLGTLRRIYRFGVYRHHSCIAVYLRVAILFHRILCLVHHYQIILFRLRHQQRCLILRIPGKRRSSRSGQSQYRLGRSEQCHDTPARRDTY